MLHKETTASSTLTRPLRRIGSAGAALGIILGTALGAAPVSYTHLDAADE